MIDGVVRAPSAFSSTLTLPFSRMATQALVVPRSIPMILPIFSLPKLWILRDLASRATAAHKRLNYQMGARGRISSLLVNRRRSGARRLADHHHGRAQQTAVEQVALLEHLQHAARLDTGAFFHGHGLMVLG